MAGAAASPESALQPVELDCEGAIIDGSFLILDEPGNHNDPDDAVQDFLDASTHDSAGGLMAEELPGGVADQTAQSGTGNDHSIDFEVTDSSGSAVGVVSVEQVNDTYYVDSYTVCAEAEGAEVAW